MKKRGFILTANEVLKKYFGYDSFRIGQDEIIQHILKKEDCLGVMPTGARKVYLLSDSSYFILWCYHCYFSSYFPYEGSSR